MSSTTANSNAAACLLWVALILPAGWMLRSLERSQPAPTAVRAEQWRALAGHGGFPAMLGGLRPVVAGAFWLRAYLAWERQDAAAMVTLIGLTVAADERPAYFWLNGARMIACDLPEWLPGDAPGPVRQRAREECAQQALRFLDQGLRWRGLDAELLVEAANIHLRRRGDVEAAARFYRRAAEQPGAPFYAARIHADLLDRLGRRPEALDWLRQVLPGLPADDPAARREVVVARIQALEQELARN